MKQNQGMDKLLHLYFNRNWSLTHAQISQIMKFVSHYIPYSYVDLITYTYTKLNIGLFDKRGICY